MTTKSADNRPSYAGAPAKAPGKPQGWQTPERGHSAGYKGHYASNGKFAEAARKGAR